MKKVKNVKEDILFIINPISGTGSKANIEDFIEKKLDHKKFNPIALYTQRAGHGTEIALEYSSKGIKKIIAVGGDGTVNEIAKSLVHTQTALGIIPGGSGNGLARHLKIPMQSLKAIELLNTAKVEKIDYGLINKKIHFFCTCGVGFDAVIGHKFARADSRGLKTYLSTTLNEFAKYKSKKYEIKFDDSIIKRKAFLITVANASQYGNNAYIAPHANIQDGLLDLCILSPFPPHMLLDLGFKLFSKNVDRSDFVEIIRTKEVKIIRSKKGEIHFDGEPAILGKKIKIKIFPKGLNVLVSDNF